MASYNKRSDSSDYLNSTIFPVKAQKETSRLKGLLGPNISTIMAQDFGAVEATKVVEPLERKRISGWRSDRRKWIAFWILWLAVIICTTTMPWSNFKGHSHWGLVRWIPFGDPHLVLSDVVANVALFLPLGYFYFMAMPLRSRRATILSGLVMSALLLGGAEFFQVFCPNRIPSTTDILTNVCGTGIGLCLGNLFTKGSREKEQGARDKEQRVEGQTP